MVTTRSEAPRRAGSRDRVRLMIVDDHRSFAEALEAALALEDDIEVIGVFNDGDGAIAAAARDNPDVVLMDVQMPGSDGIATTRSMKEASPDTRVVMLSAFDDELLIARAVDAGASGFLSKSKGIKEVAGSVRAASQGEPLMSPEEIRRVIGHLRKRREREATVRDRLDRLTRREVEILQAMADGSSSEEMAATMGISRHTLRTHVQNILFKLKVHSKLEALAVALRHGKVSVDGQGDSPLAADR